MALLDIHNRPEQTVRITNAHTSEIKEYLSALDLIVNVPIETAEPGTEPVEHILFTRPGMRSCQAQALVHALMRDELFLYEVKHSGQQVSAQYRHLLDGEKCRLTERRLG